LNGAHITRLTVTLLATACLLLAVLTYRTPQIPHDRQADRAALAPPPPSTAGAGPAKQALGPPTSWCYSGRGRLQAVGPTVGWSYGHVQVAVTLAGSRILDVAVAQLATTNPVSQRRSAAAAGRLRGAVLASQRADVDVVSGATYTSQAYLRSLQAALDKAHMPGRR
jgi:FMN-binding domain